MTETDWLRSIEPAMSQDRAGATVDATPDLRSLPRPTDDQSREFAKHVGEAHSWYKHLPLLTGGQFVVFLAPDAGIGRLVAQLDGTGYRLITPPEGPVFTEAHPRLHYSWQTTEEYRRRFGYLDYARRTHDGDTFGRDIGGPLELPAEIWERCTFTLFPYVTGGGVDSVRWAHPEAVERLRAGAAHPQREAVLDWARLVADRDEAWSSLTEVERERILADAETDPPAKSTAGIDHYLDAERSLQAVYYERLRPGELEKIRRALAALRTWLEEQ